MAEIDVEDTTTLDDVGEKAGQSSSEADLAGAELATTPPSDPAFQKIQANAEAAVSKTNAQIGEALGLDPRFGTDPTYTDNVLEDSSSDKRTTPDGKKLGEFSDSLQKGTKAAVEKIQAENGETGKDIKDSPETQKTIFEKYGAKALMFALVVGGLAAALVELRDMGKAMSGCYQTLTCASSQTSPVKVLCTNDTVPNQTFTQCSCSGVKATSCASPTCDGTGCPSYYWQDISALQALAGLPGIIAGGLLNPITNNASKLLKSIAIYGGIFILILIIGYVAFKFIERDVLHAGNTTTKAKAAFRRRK